MKILIVGGSGGIGAALIETLLATQQEITLYATYRSTQPAIQHTNLTWFQVDASLENQVAALASQISRVDILINTIGFLHQDEQNPEKSINEFDPTFFYQNISANTLPTLLLAKYFATSLKSKKNTYFIAISAKIGSIEDNQIGGWISYRSSKAALNMALKTISIEWHFKLPHCCVLAFHPGTTDTQLSAPFQRNVPQGKLFTPHYVAKQLLALIETKGPESSGKFFSYSGEELPW